MKQGYTHIAVVLDSSGSMGNIIDDTIGGFNAFLKAQKEVDGTATMSMVEFYQGAYGRHFTETPAWLTNKGEDSIQVKTRMDFIDIKKAEELSRSNYTVAGGTPLLDTIGKLIKDTEEKLRRLPSALHPDRVLFVIITDGEENASRVYNYEAINRMISRQKEEMKWEFVFLGANQDAIAEASKMGISVNNSMTYGITKGEMRSAYTTLAAKATSFRVASSMNEASASLAFTNEERSQAKN